MKADRYASWGGYPPARHTGAELVFWEDEPIPAGAEGHSILPYGLGRSYGDVCLNDGNRLLLTSRLDRFVAFDSERGILAAEAGVTLADILEVVVPKGWFLAVTPGTKHVTLGGAIANDVHGKNHHADGSFGCFVRSMTIRRSDGHLYRTSPEENADLFAATIGGLGLTGLIVSAEIKLTAIESAIMDVEQVRFNRLDHFFMLRGESDEAYRYTVAWLDGQDPNGRGIFLRANHSPEGFLALGRGRSVRVPFDAPSWLLGRPLMRLFNHAYYARGNRRGVNRVHYENFFYPLDAVSNWNRLYGRRGFLQYQFVVPEENALEVIRDVLGRCRKAGLPPYLAVLKGFGTTRSPGMLSFPRPGVTLALDFPNRGEALFRMLDELDAAVISAGGALYPAKDARMSPGTFQKSFPQMEIFSRFVDPAFSSSFWRRVTASEA